MHRWFRKSIAGLGLCYVVACGGGTLDDPATLEVKKLALYAVPVSGGVTPVPLARPGFVAPDVSAGETGGTTLGSFSVTDDGQATYYVPLVPAPLGVLRPELHPEP